MLYVNPIAGQMNLRADPADLAALREQRAFQELERIVLYQLVREMRKSTGEGLFGKSREREFFEDIFNDHLAGLLAESGAFGLAAQMQKQLDATQGNTIASRPSPPATPPAFNAPSRSAPACAASAHLNTIPQDAREYRHYGHAHKEQRVFADI